MECDGRSPGIFFFNQQALPTATHTRGRFSGGCLFRCRFNLSLATGVDQSARSKASRCSSGSDADHAAEQFALHRPSFVKHGDRLVPFLDKPGLFHNQHRIGIAQMRNNIGTQSLPRRRPGSSHTWSASQRMPARKSCTPSGVRSPACSANCQPFLRSTGHSRPCRSARARRRGAIRRKRGAICSNSASSPPIQSSASSVATMTAFHGRSDYQKNPGCSAGPSPVRHGPQQRPQLRVDQNARDSAPKRWLHWS